MMIDRRSFLIASIFGPVAWTNRGHAQGAARVPRVGILSPGSPPPNDPFKQAERFEAGLRELGWSPGTTVLLDYRYASGNLDRLAAMAGELVNLRVDAIVARGQTIAAAKAATSQIPIVMAADPDPVGNGFIKSLARPGGNITGFTTQVFELEAKHLELLKQAMPSISRVAMLDNARNTVVNSEQIKRREVAAANLNLKLTDIAIGEAAELDAKFAGMGDAGIQGVLISGTLWFIDPKAVAALAQRHRIATVTNLREFANAGALMTYGVSFSDLHRRVAKYVDVILKGANPAELPVEQPTKFDLVINLRTARALGLDVPAPLLATADEVIE